MTTVINNPSTGVSADEAGGAGIIIGALVVILALVLFFIYGLPAMRANQEPNSQVPNNTNVTITTPPIQPVPVPVVPAPTTR